ncbi:MAG: DUF3995 domain-containing protein [Bacteroidia bacterium]
MHTLITIILVSIFLSISGIHFYWAFGGVWGTKAVFPTKADSGEMTFQPPFLATIVVALGLMVMAWTTSALNGLLTFPLSEAWIQGIMIGIATIFAIRAIGDFKYAGLFKKVKNTAFGINDTRYYTPLCLLISTLSITLLWLN